MKLNRLFISLSLCMSCMVLKPQAPLPPVEELEEEEGLSAFEAARAAEEAELRQAEAAEAATSARQQAFQRYMKPALSKEELYLTQQIQRQANEKAGKYPILANKSLPTQNNIDEWARYFADAYGSAYTSAGGSGPTREKLIAALKLLFNNLDIQQLTVASVDEIEQAYSVFTPLIKVALAERFEALKPKMQALERELENQRLAVIQAQRALDAARLQENPLTLQRAKENLRFAKQQARKTAATIANSKLGTAVTKTGVAVMEGIQAAPGTGYRLALASIPPEVKATLKSSIARAQEAVAAGQKTATYIFGGQAYQDVKARATQTATAVKDTAYGTYQAGKQAVSSAASTGAEYARAAGRKAYDTGVATKEAVTSAGTAVATKVGQAYAATGEALGRAKKMIVGEPGEKPKTRAEQMGIEDLGKAKFEIYGATKKQAERLEQLKTEIAALREKKEDATAQEQEMMALERKILLQGRTLAQLTQDKQRVEDMFLQASAAYDKETDDIKKAKIKENRDKLGKNLQEITEEIKAKEQRKARMEAQKKAKKA